jgi:FAD/FMN-containing dehydrogenase
MPRHLLCVALVAQTSFALLNPAVQPLSGNFTFDNPDTCVTIERAYPSIEVSYPYSSAYRTTSSEYWNKACTKLSPSCIVYPSSASDIAKIIDVLSANSEGFAIKGGGHMPNCGFNSVERGPLIALSKMKKIEYNAQKETVKIQPGNRWQDVAVELAKFKRAAVGGRVGHVGVPGYLLGGGLSFHATQYGWASTHVLEYEIVLSNGTIVRANKERNQELHRALQAGGNQYGVVTAFTLRTFPQGPVSCVLLSASAYHYRFGEAIACMQAIKQLLC